MFFISDKAGLKAELSGFKAGFFFFLLYHTKNNNNKELQQLFIKYQLSGTVVDVLEVLFLNFMTILQIRSSYSQFVDEETEAQMS